MLRTGLVLSGGGLLGVGWELGVLRGLQEKGFDIGGVDVVVGTSAGAIVGVIAGSGSPLVSVAPVAERDRQLTATLGEMDMEQMAPVFQVLGSGGTSDQARRAELGAIARQCRIPEDSYVELVGQYLPQVPWPRALKITAVDADDGTFVVWGVDDSIPLLRATAASGAVPGLFPPVSISRHRYMDGAIRSPTSADLADGSDLLVIVAAPSQSSDTDRQIARETASIRAAGGQIFEIRPDAESILAFGTDPFDARPQSLVFDAGRRQGEAVGGQVASRSF